LPATVTIHGWTVMGMKKMDHSEAIQQMIAERYLLDELTLDVREAFEEHLFDCPECALDLRAGAAFVEVAKAQLPKLAGVASVSSLPRSRKPRVQREWWLSWLQPAFADPGLRAEASQPHLLPWAPLHGAMRDGAPLAITADRRHGVALPVDLPAQSSPDAYASYSLDLYNPQGKLAWTGVVAPPSDNGGQRLSLVIPGAMLQNGAYSLVVSGAGAHGERTVIDRYAFDLRITIDASSGTP